jgi:hypothetical protein
MTHLLILKSQPRWRTCGVCFRHPVENCDRQNSSFFTISQIARSLAARPRDDTITFGATQMLVDGHYRKYLSRLHERLGETRLNVVRAFERIRLELYVEPADGMFAGPDSRTLRTPLR